MIDRRCGRKGLKYEVHKRRSRKNDYKNNSRIDEFIKSIPSLLGKREEELKMNDWFKAQELIRKEDFYSTSIILLDLLRNDGWDIKIDMQSSKLVYHGRQ